MLNEQRLREGVDAVIERALARSVVGTVVCVHERGRLVYARAAGFADREAAEPMHEQSVFRLASVTKPIVTVAALRLIEGGQLSLADEVTRYLPAFRPMLPDGSAPAITIRQLLTHTAGLSYGFMQPSDGSYLREHVSDGLDQPGLTFGEELPRIVRAGLSYLPGTSWSYSLAIDVLGAVIEQATQQSLPRVVAEQVTEPLAMHSTSFRGGALVTPYADGSPPKRMGERELVPFLELSGLSFEPKRTFDQDSFPSGGAGMNGSAHDVLRLLEMVRTGGGGLLSRETTRAMLTNQTGTYGIALGPGWGFGYGGAVLVDPSAARSPQTAGTWSWGGVYGHSWFVDPARELSVVGLTNTATAGMMGPFPDRVRNAVYRALD